MLFSVFNTILLSPLVFLKQVSSATGDVGLHYQTPSDAFLESTGLPPSGNATRDQLRVELSRRVQEMNGCDVARTYQSSLWMECTEWCDLKDYGKHNVLRYHVRLSGIGADTEQWCDFIHSAIDIECGWKRPFYQCNYNGDDSRARVDPKLGIYLVNGYNDNKVEFHDGVNIRFDWWGWWEPRDAMHDCVAGAIRLATCRGVEFANGRRCIPVLHADPDGSAEFQEGFVKPDGCHWANEVPEGSQ
ncbi:hypothetical protein SLS62_007992 [Diatrype stigma]|uniref:Uncharacterized protein n=1 Tax=Diatrype stigma TaxID=117547 RepID=A0AAN9YQ86_9PEZI